MSATVYDQIKKLNSKERHYLATHPQHAFSITQAFIKSADEEKKRFGRNGWNDEADAFRHCFWSAILARDLGYFSALQFTAAHESVADNPREEKEMDLHNNKVGLLIGRTGGSDQKLARGCMAALTGGQLKVLTQGAAI